MTKNQAWEKFLDECGECEPDIETSWYAGWGSCNEVLQKEIEKLKDKLLEMEDSNEI